MHQIDQRMKESQSHTIFVFFFSFSFLGLKLTTAVWATGIRSGRTCSKSIHCWPEPYANQRGELVVAFWQALLTVHLLKKNYNKKKRKKHIMLSVFIFMIYIYIYFVLRSHFLFCFILLYPSRIHKSLCRILCVSKDTALVYSIALSHSVCVWLYKCIYVYTHTQV